MMLDLVVQPSDGEVDEPAAPDVAGGEHLPPQKVDLLLGGEHRHSLVVRREGAAQIEPEQSLLHQDEEHGPERGQDEKHGPEVTGDVNGQQPGLPGPVTAVSRWARSRPPRLPEQRPDAGQVQAGSFQEQQGN
jgi:hypothetical protein